MKTCGLNHITHSPVLVSEMLKIHKLDIDKRISIWLSKMSTLVTTVEDKKLKMKITKISCLTKDKPKSGFFQEQEYNRMELEAKEYLESLDTGNQLQTA